MSKKDKASDAVALALAGVLTVTSVPAGSTANSMPDTLNHPAPITEMASINRSPTMTLPPGVELPADSINPGQSTQPAQAQPIRYLDVTKDTQQGWALAQTTAASASRNNRVVIISYLDPPTTRALYDAAVPFTQPPTNLPVVGLIRSPSAPPSVSVTPNPLGFDVFFNGSVIPPMEKPDPRFTRTDQLSAFMRGIHRNHFAAATASVSPDTRLAVNMATGGKSSGGSGSATGSGSAGGKSGDLAAVNFNPDF
ncbi:MAG: hypothetical protein KA099_01685 [Alphaproteobacteria bacterium]|nr:hypothetical protein [Alphaproteobacteria bacterium]MBP7758222.1 hypothetical protein [Alphaproteobacteria bacterium]MBP7761635.1 hypothetical protein [Alphaproteobacteria bacterium]MBP7904013.1 hypothetical protein [Alphaproteobacteria bacterium]